MVSANHPNFFPQLRRKMGIQAKLMGLAKSRNFDGSKQCLDYRLPLHGRTTAQIGRCPISFGRHFNRGEVKAPYDSVRYSWRHPQLPLRACFRNFEDGAIDFFVTPDASVEELEKLFPPDMSGSQRNFTRYVGGFKKTRLHKSPWDEPASKGTDNYASSSDEESVTGSECSEHFSENAWLDGGWLS